MQASGLAQRAGHPLIDAFGLDDVTVLAEGRQGFVRKTAESALTP